MIAVRAADDVVQFDDRSGRVGRVDRLCVDRRVRQITPRPTLGEDCPDNRLDDDCVIVIVRVVGDGRRNPSALFRKR